jgi:hypothetical protein
MPRKKKEIILEDNNEVIINYTEPIITSIVINNNGTIYGLADNKIYCYDNQTKTWSLT